MSKFTYIDMFAGIGGFRQALDNCGGRCVFSSEIDKYCREVYKANYNEEPHGDITTIDPCKIPDHDILTAGFPCQPFSICGKKKGFDDTRGTLFFNICKIISIKNPRIVILENVKHLIHHDGGETFKIMLKALNSLNYKVSYKIMNSINFGVPQNRERLIIIATKNNLFNFSTIDYSYEMPKLKDFLDKKADFEFLNESEYTLIDNPKKQASGLIFAGYRNKEIRKKGVKPDTIHLSRTHKQPNRIYSDEGTHPTLISQETTGRFFIYLSNSNKVRKLTLNECYRIMGFKDNFKKHPSKSECYKQIGNSVCIPMIEKIANSILKNHLCRKKY